MPITNFDTLNALRTEAARTGHGSKSWIEFATTMFDSFPALYETAKRMNAELAERHTKGNRELFLEEALRNLIAQIELHTDCMDGMIDSEALVDWVEEAERVLGYGVTPEYAAIAQHFFRTWIDVSEKLPDSDVTVVVNTPNSSEPVWLGFHDGECWRNVEGFPITVTAWAEMPEPIQAQSTQGGT